MKLKSLKIKNVGLIADTTITIDKALLLFYGEVRQGKSTILNAVRWVCGGPFPQDIIRHGEKEASIELEFDDGMIARSFYVAKDKSTKARDVVFVKDGKPVASPVSEIKRLLNPFLLDQDFLRNKNDTERRQYFAELFAVDTKELDVEFFKNDRSATELRAKIKGYGEIDLTAVEKVDIGSARQELNLIVSKHESDCAIVDQKNEAIRADNASIDRSVELMDGLKVAIAALEKELDAKRQQLARIMPGTKRELLSKPVKPDTSELETKIQNAGAQNVRAEQYEKNVARDSQRKADEVALSNLEKRQREIKVAKQAKLKTVSDTCGIKGLAFDDDGNFIYEGCQAGMLSTSQIMRLSSELSALYPEGFGLELLDRGESLGRAIFDYVELAKKKKATVMATIVGERPAQVPAEIGVFVVRDGVVIPDKPEGDLL